MTSTLMDVDDRAVAWLTAENLVADDVELDGHPLLLCLDAVLHCLLNDSIFTDAAFAIFDNYKS